MELSQDKSLTATKVQLLAAMIMFMPIAYLIVCVLLDRFVLEDSGGLVDLPHFMGMILFVFGLVICVTSTIAAHIFRHMMLAQSPDKGLATKLQVVLVILTFGQTGAVFGLIYFVLTGNLLQAAILIALGFTATVALFPTRRWLLEGIQGQTTD